MYSAAKKFDLCYTARSPTGCLIYEIKNVNKSRDTVPLKRLFHALVHNFILIIQNQLDLQDSWAKHILRSDFLLLT